jgi:hypothetical protein
LFLTFLAQALFSAEEINSEERLSASPLIAKRAVLQVGIFTGFGISKHVEHSAFPDNFLVSSSKRVMDFSFFGGVRTHYFFLKKIGIMFGMDFNRSNIKEDVVLSSTQKAEEKFKLVRFDFSLCPLFRLGYVIIYPGIYYSLPISFKRVGFADLYSMRDDVGIKLGLMFTGYVYAISQKIEYSLGLEFNYSLLKRWAKIGEAYTGSKLMRVYAVLGIMYSVK